MRLPLEAKLKCPHCLVSFKNEWEPINLGSDPDGFWTLRRTHCTNCDRMIVVLDQHEKPGATGGLGEVPLPKLKARRMVWPKGSARAPVPPEVPTGLAADYVEACNVLADSPKASAGLSRRCLQNLLIDRAGVKAKDLYDQIQEVLDSGTLPSHLADDLDAVRVVGNFGAHPIKSKVTGQIVDVEPGEAEWNLEVLEGLFDFYFVQPERQKRRRDALNVKLKEAGKPPLR